MNYNVSYYIYKIKQIYLNISRQMMKVTPTDL